MELEIIVLVLLIFFVSTTIRSFFGFGDALLAMPLLTIVIGVKTAVPIVALVAIIIGLSILLKTWREINFKQLIPLIVASIAGIPIGLIYLKDTSEVIVKLVLAIILISFSLYRLFRPNLLYLKSERLSFIFGLFSGILGGAYNTNGPPIVLYGAMRRWEPSQFRSNLQGIFLPTNLFIATGHGLAGFWTEEAIILFFYCIPVVILSIILGSYLNKRIPAEKFVKLVDIFLIIIGLVLVVHSLF